jgi:hypothetical protein
MNHSFHFRNRTATVIPLVVAAVGFGGFTAAPAADSPNSNQTTVTLGAETAGQRCSGPVDGEWRDWTRPRGVAIPR